MSANEVLETYKVHVELAERVASLRESMNQLYSGMVTSIVAASILLYRLAPDAEPALVLPIVGGVVSVSWLFAVLSVTGRLYAKSTVLKELEKRLPFDFLIKEDRVFNASRVRHLFRRKHTLLFTPIAFLAVCVVWLCSIVGQ